MALYDFQPRIGDICRDGTGLRVKVKDVDMYDYVHFCPLEGYAEREAVTGEMSCVAFVRRFRRIGLDADERKAV